MIGLIISGLPASGKGTQSALVAAEYHLAHIDADESLRQEVAKGTETGKEARKFIAEGVLVPDSIIEKLVRQKIEDNKEKAGVVFDSFPRTVEQAKVLEQFDQVYGLKVKGFIFLEVDEEVAVERINQRAQESDRKDDQSEITVQKRIEEQRKQLQDLTSYYQDKDKLFEVNGNAGIPEVSEAVKKTIEEHGLAEA